MIEDMIRRLRSRVDAMVSRAVINRVNDALKTQRLQLTILEGDVEDNVELMQPYGLSFVPPGGAEAIALSVGGARSHTVAICANAPGERPTGGSAQTGGLYTKGEWRLFIDADGVVHVGAETGAAPVARADLVDAEIDRIWNTLTTWTVAPQDGGAALQAKANIDSAAVQSTAADKAKVT